MQRKRTIPCILLIISTLLLSADHVQAESLSSTTEAVDPDIRTLKEIYTSTDPEEKYDFPEIRAFEDWEGELKSVTYEIINEERQKGTPVLREVVEFSWSEHMPEPDSIMIRGGVTYYLTEVDITESPKSGRIVTLDDSIRYYGYMSPPDAAEQIKAEYTDPATGERIEAYLLLKELKTEKYSWREDVTFELYAEDPDAGCYELGGKKFGMGELPGAEDYPAILELLSLNPERYRIKDLIWSEGFPSESIIQGTCSRYAADYIAYYEAEVPLPDLPGYIGTAIYEAPADEHAEEILYTIQASAVYEKQADFPAGPVTATAAGTIFIFLLLRKRRKREKQ